MKDSVNPYASPLAVTDRGPFLVRLGRAVRRAAATYFREIREAGIGPVEHVAAWAALLALTLATAAGILLIVLGVASSLGLLA